MNKKFFTLIAGLFMLAASLGTATAADPVYAQGKATSTISPQLPAIDEVSDRLYQLGVGEASIATTTSDHLLAMKKDAQGKFYLQAVDGTVPGYGGTDLPSTLWRIHVTKNAEGALSYSFTNIATNVPLTYVATLGTDISGNKNPTITTASDVRGEVNLWKWQPAVKLDNPADRFGGRTLTSAYGAKLDSTVTLVSTTSLAAGNTPTIALVKYSLGGEPGSTKLASFHQIYLTPYDATPVLLTPDDLNSMLWTQDHQTGKVSFSFTPNVTNSVLKPENIFTEGSFKAVWAKGYPASYSGLTFVAGNWTSYAPYTGLSSVTGTDYTTVNQAIKNAEFDRDYTYSKLNFARTIGNLLYASRNLPIFANAAATNGVFVDIATALGYANPPTLNGAIAQIMAHFAATPPYAPLSGSEVLLGSRTKVGSAAYIVANHSDVNTYLDDPAKPAFGKQAIEAIITYFENIVDDPNTSTATIAAFGGGVIDPLITALTGGISAWPIPDGNTGTTAINNAIDAVVLWSPAKIQANALAVSNAYIAKDALESALKSGDRITNGWISLIVKGNANDPDAEYVSVDTAKYEIDKTVTSFKVQKFVDVAENYYPNLALNDLTRLDLNGRFNFQFHYYPSQDSLVIRAGGFAKIQENQKNWGALNTIANLDLGIHNAGIYTSPPTSAGLDPKYPTNLDRNVVKLAYLAPAHSEVSVGSSEFAAGQTPRTTINTLIQIGRKALTDDRTTLKTGLYFIQLKTNLPTRKALDGAYKYRHIAQYYVGLTWAHEDEAQLVDGKIQNFGYMPAAQWVVEQYPYGDGKTNLVSIYNREYPTIRVEGVQLHKAGNGAYALPYSSGNFPSTDTLIITEISKTQFPEAYTSEYLGYYKEKTDKYYKLDYLSGIQLGNYLKVKDSQTDSLIYVDIKDGKVYFELEEVKDKPEGAYGFEATKDHSFKALKRTAYNIRIRAPHLLFADGKYIVKIGTSYTGEDVYAVSAVPKSEAVTFFMKENNRIASTPYFALEDAYYNSGTKLWYEGSWRVKVKDGSLYLITSENFYEKSVSAFALVDSDIYLYRRFDGEKYGDLQEPYGDKTNSPLYLKFYKYNNSYELLSENSKNNTNYRDEVKSDISFLGLYNKAQSKEINDTLSYTFYVDTAYVRGKTIMPQYMLALRPDIQLEDTLVYDGKGQWFDRYGNPVSPLETKQDTIIVPSLVKADYLFNAQDSVAAGNKEYEGKFAYGAEKTTRLAFVTGVHYLDTFYVLPDKYKTYSVRDIASNLSVLYALDSAKYKHPLGANTHYLSTTKEKNGTYTVNNHKSVVFQFRLIDEQNRRFLIETTKDKDEPEFGPNKGQWVKIQNGVPVISENVSVAQAAQNGAEIFDVTVGEEGSAVANEAVAETTVKVISETGAVTILNAAGKSVAISNILGQTVASAVLTSDNARVALPKGIVIVAVEGEPAIKAVVK